MQSKEKYDKKIQHLKRKYKDSLEQKDDEIPDCMTGEYSDLSIFDRYKFEEIEELEFELRLIGDVTVSKNEVLVMKLHPKLSVIKCLEENDFQFEQELAYAKGRMELAEEDREKEDEKYDDKPNSDTQIIKKQENTHVVAVKPQNWRQKLLAFRAEYT